METQKLIDQITDSVHKNANAKAVFGEKVAMDGITIIPVAKVRVYGGGGGGGAEAPTAHEAGHLEKGSGMGVGLSIQTTPLGYIKIQDGQAGFERIVDVSKVALAAIALLGLVLWRLGRR